MGLHVYQSPADQVVKLNKSKAKNITSHYLDIKPQKGEVQAAYDTAQKKDGMADALLQALAYANVGVTMREFTSQRLLICLTSKLMHNQCLSYQE